jgi:hypothetical protein
LPLSQRCFEHRPRRLDSYRLIHPTPSPLNFLDMKRKTTVSSPAKVRPALKSHPVRADQTCVSVDHAGSQQRSRSKLTVPPGTFLSTSHLAPRTSDATLRILCETTFHRSALYECDPRNIRSIQANPHRVDLVGMTDSSLSELSSQVLPLSSI